MLLIQTALLLQIGLLTCMHDVMQCFHMIICNKFGWLQTKILISVNGLVFLSLTVMLCLVCLFCVKCVCSFIVVYF